MRILLIHGWGFNAAIWTRLEENLRQTIPECAIDSLTVEIWNDCESISSQITTPTVVIAWSLGGNIAVDIAAENPHVKALMLVNYNPCFIQRDDWPLGMEQHKLMAMREALTKDADECLRQFISWCCYGNKASLRWMKNYTPIVNSGEISNLHLGLERLLNDDQRLKMQSLSGPVEMLFSENDVLVSAKLAQHCQAFSESIHTRVLSSASHLSPLLETRNIEEILHRLIQTQ